MDLNSRVQNVKSDSKVCRVVVSRLVFSCYECTQSLMITWHGMSSIAMQMSYWKSALNDFRVNHHDMVKLKTGAMELAKEFDTLLRLYEKQDLANIGLRETLKQVRREKDMKEKQVQLANRTIERLSVKQGMTEAQDAVKDAHIRRLETKVATMRSSGELKRMCDELEVSVKKLEEQLKAQEEQMEEAGRRARDAERENEMLKRGIQIASDQLTAARGSDEVSPSLLLAVAKGQNEAVSLSKELADAKNTIEDMEKALLTARKHLTSQHDALLRWKEFEASQLKEKKTMQEELEAAQNAFHKVKEETKHAETAHLEMKKKLTEMTSAYEVEKTRREAAEKKLESLLSTHQPSNPSEKETCDTPKSVEQLKKQFESNTQDTEKVVSIEARASGPARTLFDLATMDISTFST